MNSPSPFQRLLRIRVASFALALALHLGWALALCALIVALRRGAAGPAAGGASFIPVLLLFAAVCVAGSAALWGCRQHVVRWLRSLSPEDLTAAVASLCTGVLSLALVGLVATGLPSLSQRLSRGEMDAVMFGALVLIGLLSVGAGWLLTEGLLGATPTLPGRIEASLSRRRTD